MRNYKIYIDLFDVYKDLIRFDLYEFRNPFALVFIEASDPDDACNTVILRIMRMIMRQDSSLETRIVCRKIRKYIRIDKIYAL